MSEAEALLRLVLAAGFGALLGLEREEADKPAGVRTFSIVALGSAFFSIVSILTFGVNDAGARIPAQVVTGVGFLGAGMIIQQRGNVVGLTTAAGIWAAAAVGMGFGFGLYLLSAGGVVILLVLLRLVGRLTPGPDAGPARRDAGLNIAETGDRGDRGEADREGGGTRLGDPRAAREDGRPGGES
jgi:putative Mg2+ transporter-C (MgtC) family protein